MEDDWEDENNVAGIANTNNIIDQRAPWDAKIGAKVGEYVRKS
jgi:hypothetical protein